MTDQKNNQSNLAKPVSELAQISPVVGVIGFGGGKVSGRKRAKSLLLMSINEDLVEGTRYRWDSDFFGPYSSDITDEFRDASYKSLILTYFNAERKCPYEPVHHSFELSEWGGYLFRKYFVEHQQDIEEHIPYLMSWNMAPISLLLRKSLEAENKISENIPSKEQQKETNRIYYARTPYLRFTDEIIRALRQYWKELGIESKAERKQKGSYEIKITPRAIENRFQYIADKRAREELDKFDKWSSYEEVSSLPLFDFYFKIGVIDKGKFENSIEQVREEGEQLVTSDRFNAKIDALQDYAKISNECEGGIKLAFIDDKIKLEFSEEMINRVENWNQGMILHTLHLLEPIERGLYLTKDI